MCSWRTWAVNVPTFLWRLQSTTVAILSGLVSTALSSPTKLQSPWSPLWILCGPNLFLCQGLEHLFSVFHLAVSFSFGFSSGVIVSEGISLIIGFHIASATVRDFQPHYLILFPWQHLEASEILWFMFMLVVPDSPFKYKPPLSRELVYFFSPLCLLDSTWNNVGGPQSIFAERILTFCGWESQWNWNPDVQSDSGYRSCPFWNLVYNKNLLLSSSKQRERKIPEQQVSRSGE